MTGALRRGHRHWAPYRRWSQQHVTDPYLGHLCRKCGGLIARGKAHMLLEASGEGHERYTAREHLVGDCRGKRWEAEERRAVGILIGLWVICGALFIAAALAIMGVTR